MKCCCLQQPEVGTVRYGTVQPMIIPNEDYIELIVLRLIILIFSDALIKESYAGGPHE